MDLFEREQRIYDTSTERYIAMKKEGAAAGEEYGHIVEEYGKLLRQLRRVTKISDRTTVNLNERKLDLLDKVNYDSLTGIYNRRYMEENLIRIIKSISRYGGRLSVLMIDIDYFKKYNDTYGHSSGDECLKEVAKTISGVITRSDDFAARYGGEEFIAVLPGTGEEGACIIAERMLNGIRECRIPHEKSEAAEYVTISIGVSSGEVGHRQSGIDYIKRADEALYISKGNGRNRYTFLKVEVDRNDS